MMKKHTIVMAVVSLILALVTVPAFAADNSSSALSFGPRWHSDHSVFLELPFGDNDISYEIAWEGHEEDGYWQLGVDYAPDVSGDLGTTDYMITPYLNLLWSDGMFEGGIGGRQSYISDSLTGSDWSDFYWQFILGLRFPVGGFDLSVSTFYVFEQWGDIGDFEGKDLDYGASLSYKF